MNGLCLQFEELWKAPTQTAKDGKKVNVLCIVDRSHQRPLVVVDYSRSFKGIKSMKIRTSKMR